MTDQMCQKWLVKFHAGDFSLDNAAQPCKPGEVDNDQIETLIENNQHYSMWEIADILKISKSVKLVKMKNVSFILWKNTYKLFGQPVAFVSHGDPTNGCLPQKEILIIKWIG